MLGARGADLEPDWAVCHATFRRRVRTLLQSCLVKDRRRRVADISTALFVLEKGASLAPPGDIGMRFHVDRCGGEPFRSCRSAR